MKGSKLIDINEILNLQKQPKHEYKDSKEFKLESEVNVSSGKKELNSKNESSRSNSVTVPQAAGFRNTSQ